MDENIYLYICEMEEKKKKRRRKKIRKKKIAMIYPCMNNDQSTTIY